MKRRKLILVSLMAVVGAGTLVVPLAVAEPSQDAKPAAGQQPEMQLPPGWTAADMQACMAAAVPGKMHEHLAKSVGTWRGKNTLWMFPGAPPMKSESTATITPMLDGRFVKCEMSGDMPGMGPYNGFALYGFDNVSQKFVSTWIDNCGTGMAQGTGELSGDGNTLTWNYTYNCPLTKKPTALREVETFADADARKLEIFGIDPKSGKEFKMMEIELTRQPGKAAAAAAPAAR
jgi:hypothetical protein